MTDELRGRRVALLAADGVQHTELIQPREAVENAGAHLRLLSPSGGTIQSTHIDGTTGDAFRVNATVPDVYLDDFDALLLPGGIDNLQLLRASPDIVRFVHAFSESDKPIGAIGHGPRILIEADAVHGRSLTAAPDVHTDIRTAGGNVLDQDVVTDRVLVTGRGPESLPTFCSTIIEHFTKRDRQPSRWLRVLPSLRRR